jgi:hypothetical protein
MKTISKLASGLALVAISSSVMAATGIAQTKHNLGAGNSTGNATGGNYTNATTEICIFCHTPHGSDQSASAPLWNRKLNDTAIYTRYSSLNTTSFDATEAPIGSVSIACLSCHDGTQAMDAVLNSPGGGTGYTNKNTSAFGMDGVPDATGGLPGSYTESNPGGDVSSGWTESHKLSNLTAQDNGTVGDLIYIGTDLRNDHPVSMQYGGGGLVGTGGTTLDPDYAQLGTGSGTWGTNISIGGTGVVNTRTLPSTLRVWWVDTNNQALQQKEDMPLYTRNMNGVDQPFVECATCHDPHTNNGTFLRAPAVKNGNGSNGNGGSQVCLACHKK